MCIFSVVARGDRTRKEGVSLVHHYPTWVPESSQDPREPFAWSLPTISICCLQLLRPQGEGTFVCSVATNSETIGNEVVGDDRESGGGPSTKSERFR